MKRDHQLLNKPGVRSMSLFNLGEINRLLFKRWLDLQTFNPGWAEHNDTDPLKAPTTTGGSQQRMGSLSPIDNPLWGTEKEARRGELNVRQWPSCHTLSLNFPRLWRTINYEGLRGRSKQGKNPVLSQQWPRLPRLCLLNGFACWGTATKRANRSLGGGRCGRKAKDFFVCAPALV